MSEIIKDKARANVTIPNGKDYDSKIVVEFDIEIWKVETTNKYNVESPITFGNRDNDTIEEAKKHIVEKFEEYWESCLKRGTLLDLFTRYSLRLEKQEYKEGIYKLVEYEYMETKEKYRRRKLDNYKNWIYKCRRSDTFYQYGTADIGSFIRVLGLVKKLEKQEKANYEFKKDYYKTQIHLGDDGIPHYFIQWTYSGGEDDVVEIHDNQRAEFMALDFFIEDENNKWGIKNSNFSYDVMTTSEGPEIEKTKRDTAKAWVNLKTAEGRSESVSVDLDVQITYDEPTKQYCIICPMVGVATQGKDEDDAKINMTEAFELWWESCEEREILQDVLESHKVSLKKLDDGKYRLVKNETKVNKRKSGMFLSSISVILPFFKAKNHYVSETLDIDLKGYYDENTEIYTLKCPLLNIESEGKRVIDVEENLSEKIREYWENSLEENSQTSITDFYDKHNLSNLEYIPPKRKKLVSKEEKRRELELENQKEVQKMAELNQG